VTPPSLHAPKPGSPVSTMPPDAASRDDLLQHGTTTIRFDGAGKRFGERWIVRNLDVEVSAGTILGLIGPSGCGKTTTVRLLTGVYTADEGDVVVLGDNPSQLPTSERTAIGYLPQTPVLFDDLSLWENLNFHASLNGVPWRRRHRLEDVLSLVDLRGEERKLVRNASGGMRRRLALAATLVHDPPLLVLDEPTAGIDPLLRRQIWDHFRRLRDLGRTLVVTTQHVNEAAHCDLIVLLDEGSVISVGTPEELRRMAFGGDVIAFTLRHVVDDRALAVLREAQCRSSQTVDPYRLRVVVDQAASGLPDLLHRFEEAGVEVEESSEVPVDWDEAFIALVGRHGDS
jgi:ABC-2 type transport system ATP-binding protein